MKIVITVEEFDPNKGYLEYYLARELTKLGHKVFVFTFGWSKSVLEMTLKEGFKVISVPYIAVMRNYHVPSFKGTAYTVKFIKTEKPDVVHCQPLFSPISLLFISSQRLSKYRIVGSLMTGEYSISSAIKKLQYNFIKMIVENYINNKRDLFFALSDGWKKVITRLFNIPHQKITIIPLGADSELFRSNLAARTKIRNLLGLSDEEVVVVYSGKIITSKELDVLIKAIAPIMRQNRKVKLLIVGKGDPSYIGYLKELCLSLKISKNVIFHSWVHRTKLPSIYSASDIAVWPGGPSISIFEAASAGLPVIAKRSLITLFAIEYENGFLFKRGDVNELSEYLRVLIENGKLRKEMGLRSRLLVEQKLNWRTIAIQYLDAYEHALK